MMPFRQTFQKQRKSPFHPYNPCKRKGVLLYNHNQDEFVQTKGLCIIYSMQSRQTAPTDTGTKLSRSTTESSLLFRFLAIR